MFVLLKLTANFFGYGKVSVFREAKNLVRARVAGF